MKFSIIRIAAGEGKTTVGYDHDKDHDLEGQAIILIDGDLSDCEKKCKLRFIMLAIREKYHFKAR